MTGAFRMRGLDEAFDDIIYEFQKLMEVRTRLQGVDNLPVSLPKREQVRDELLAEQPLVRARCLDELRMLMMFPPGCNEHADALESFWQGGSYQESVFIMTRFPESDTCKDAELQGVLGAVLHAVRAAGYVPRMASDKDYSEYLWKNVEIYLLGCARGIAVVEDKYGAELNPNVTMEWGWMRAQRKKVLYLVEQEFKKERSDLTGLLKKTFSWSDPVAGVTTAVQEFLSEPPET